MKTIGVSVSEGLGIAWRGELEREGREGEGRILRFGRKSEQTCIAFMLATQLVCVCEVKRLYVCVLKSHTTTMNMYSVIYGQLHKPNKCIPGILQKEGGGTDDEVWGRWCFGMRTVDRIYNFIIIVNAGVVKFSEFLSLSLLQGICTVSNSRVTSMFFFLKCCSPPPLEACLIGG